MKIKKITFLIIGSFFFSGCAWIVTPKPVDPQKDCSGKKYEPLCLMIFGRSATKPILDPRVIVLNEESKNTIISYESGILNLMGRSAQLNTNLVGKILIADQTAASEKYLAVYVDEVHELKGGVIQLFTSPAPLPDWYITDLDISKTSLQPKNTEMTVLIAERNITLSGTKLILNQVIVEKGVTISGELTIEANPEFVYKTRNKKSIFMEAGAKINITGELSIKVEGNLSGTIRKSLGKYSVIVFGLPSVPVPIIFQVEPVLKGEINGTATGEASVNINDGHLLKLTFDENKWKKEYFHTKATSSSVVFSGSGTISSGIEISIAAKVAQNTGMEIVFDINGVNTINVNSYNDVIANSKFVGTGKFNIFAGVFARDFEHSQVFFSEEYPLSSYQFIVPAVISNIAIYNIGQTSTSISFQTSRPAMSEIWYGQSSTSLSNSKAGFTGTNHFFDIQNLSANTKYFIKIIANVNGKESTSNIQNFQTLPVATPIAPSISSCILENNVLFRCSWLQISGATSYKLYASCSSGSNACVEKLVGTATTNSVTFSPLVGDVNYTIRLTAGNSSGDSGFSIPLISQGPVTPTVPVPISSVYNKSLVVTDLNWWNSNWETEGYTISVRRASESNWTQLRTFLMSDLTGKTTFRDYIFPTPIYSEVYYYQVFASNIFGAGKATQFSVYVESPYLQPSMNYLYSSIWNRDVSLYWSGVGDYYEVQKCTGYFQTCSYGSRYYSTNYSETLSYYDTYDSKVVVFKVRACTYYPSICSSYSSTSVTAP